MTHRARAAAFAVLALVCAALAAAVAGRYSGGIESQLGELSAVVVAARELSPSRSLRRGDVREALEVRRVPARFAPPDALVDAIEAVGQRPRGLIPAGSYVTASRLRAPSPRASAGGRSRIGAHREALEISVAGAAALVAAGDPVGGSFDVVATSEPRLAGGARTAVVARDVRLLELGAARAAARAGGGPHAAAIWTATVAVRRREALRLIEADNYARELRLIGAGSSGAR